MNVSNFCKNGVCSQCGQCCSDILHLDNKEIERIETYIKEHNIKPSPYKIIDNGKPTLDLSCPFRNDVFKKCNIYEVRPDICKVFKCDYSRKDIIENRDRLNTGKKPRSLRLVFFNDDTNQKLMEKHLKMKVYGKKEK